MNKLLNGDSIELLDTIEPKSIDLVLTDPPFFMPASHYQSRVKWQRCYSDLSPLKTFWHEVVKKLKRVLKDDGHLITFCNADSFPVFYEPLYNNFDKLKSLIWDKKRVGLGRCFRHQHELIIWSRYSESKIINDGKLRADVLSFPPTLTKDRDHPVEKPVELLKEIITPLTNPGDIVLDPFMGGGSTIIAANELGRQYIGIEMDENYFNTVKSKLCR